MDRNVSLDYAKGIAIYLMVLAHSYTNYSSSLGITTVINSFHMPFFFIVSGILYRLQYDGKILKIGLGRKIKQLLVPYCIWAGLLTTMNIGLGTISSGFDSASIRTKLIDYITFNCGPMWFLFALFVALCVFSIVLRGVTPYNCDRTLFLTVITAVVLMSLSMYLGPKVLSNLIVKSIMRGAIGSTFILFGFILMPIIMRKGKTYISILVVIIDGLFIWINGNTELVHLKFHNPILFVLTGILGSYLLIQLCLQIEKRVYFSTLLSWGKNSIIILCLHWPIIVIYQIVDYSFLGGFGSKLGFLEGILVSIFIMVVLTLCMPLLLKAPIFFGIKSSKKV